MHEIFIKITVPFTFDSSTLSGPLLHIFHGFFNLWTYFRIIS